MLLDKRSDYGIRAMVRVARAGRMTSCREIARGERIPLAYLRVVVARLSRSGLVRVKEGSAGGITLSMPADRIRLADIIFACQGSVVVSRCLFRGRPCPHRQRCLLRKELKKIEEEVVCRLERITVKDLLPGQRTTGRTTRGRTR